MTSSKHEADLQAALAKLRQAGASPVPSPSASTPASAPAPAQSAADRQAGREARARRAAQSVNSPVWRWLGRGAWALAGLAGALLLAWVVAFIHVENRAPSAAAQAMLDAPAPLPGRNAFAALWLLEQDVPPAQLQAVADADMAAIRRDGVDAARASYRTYPAHGVAKPEEGEVPWCSSRVPDCLSAVRAQPQAYAVLTAPYDSLWQRVADLAQYELLQLPNELVFTYEIDYTAWPRAMTAHAVALAQSPSAAHVRAMCQQVATTRRLANQDGRAMSFHGIDVEATRHGLQMLAQLLNENPALAPTDWADCRAALAADAQWPQQVCHMGQGEVRWTAATLHESLGGEVGGPGLSGAVVQGLSWLGTGGDRIATHAMAELASEVCTPTYAQALRAGQLPEPQQRSAWQQLLLTVRAPVAVAMGMMDAPDYRLSARIAAEAEALRAMGRSWLWWREQLVREGPSGPLAQAMAQGDVARLNALLGARPADVQLPGHPLTVVRGEQGLVLRLAMWQSSREWKRGKSVEHERLVDVVLPRLP